MDASSLGRAPDDHDETWYYLDQLARTTIEWGYAKQGVALARTVDELYPGTARALEWRRRL